MPISSLPFHIHYTTKKVDTHTFVSVYFHFTDAEAESLAALLLESIYLPPRSTAWRTKLIGGTGWGSCMVNTICGVFGSVSGSPWLSVIMGAVMVKGLVSGPTTST